MKYRNNTISIWLSILFLLMASGLAMPIRVHAQPVSEIPTARASAPEIKLAENAFVRGTPFPEWADALSEIPDGSDNSAVSVRLSETSFYVERGNMAVFTHRAIQANEASTLSQIGQTEIAFQADYQHVQLHMLRIHRGTQVLDKLNEADIRFLRREPQLDLGIYGGMATAAIVVNDIRSGDTLEMAYTVTGTNPVFGDRFFEAASWDNVYPTLRRRVTLNAPEDRHILYKMIGADQKNVPKPTESHRGGRHITRFDTTGLPAFDVESNMPVDYQSMRWIQFSEFESWREVRQWAEGLFSATTQPAVLSEALAAARAAKSPDEQVAQALAYVQNDIRYLSISLGENSHRPYPPEQVLARRYGDCKDKSLLLVTMLRQLGFEASPVLLSTSFRQSVEQTLPSPQLFNHAIVRAVVNGKTYFLDPTLLNQTGHLDDMSQHHANTHVLVVDAGNDKLTIIPPLDNDALITNTRIEHVLVKKMTDPMQLQVQLQYAGATAEAMRTAVSQLSHEQIRKFYEGNLGTRYPRAVLQGDPKINDDRSNNRITVELQFSIRDFFEVSATQWLLHYDATNMHNLFHVPSNPNRASPLSIPGYPSISRYQFEVELPEEFDAHYAPTKENIQDPTFSFSRSLAFSGRQIKLESELKLRNSRVAASAIPGFLANLNKFGQVLQGGLAIKKSDLRSAGGSLAAAPFKQTVVERLEKTVADTGKVIADAKLTGTNANASLCERARASAYLGRSGSAMEDIQNAVRQQPNAPEMLRCRAEIELITGDFKGSEHDFSRALALGLFDSGLYQQRGIANFYLGKFDLAKSDFSQAAAKADNADDKKRTIIWRLLAVRRSGLPVGVVDGAERASTDGWLDIAVAMLSNKQSSDAMLDAVHKESGENLDIALAEAYFYLGQYYLVSGDQLKARLYFQHTIDKGVLYSQYHSAALRELERLKS